MLQVNTCTYYISKKISVSTNAASWLKEDNYIIPTIKFWSQLRIILYFAQRLIRMLTCKTCTVYTHIHYKQTLSHAHIHHTHTLQIIICCHIMWYTAVHINTHTSFPLYSFQWYHSWLWKLLQNNINRKLVIFSWNHIQ